MCRVVFGRGEQVLNRVPPNRILVGRLHKFLHEHPQGNPAQARFGADVCRHAGAGALAGRGDPGRAGGVLPRGVRAFAGAWCNAGAVIQTRRLTDTETTSSIVLYFSLVCAAGGLLTLPFGWVVPSAWEFAVLAAIGLLGGLGHLVLTESYRYAPASVIAPYDYTAILFAFLLGYVMFGEVPTSLVVVGAAIVVAAGLFVLWRERRLGLKRARDAEGPPSGA